MEPWLLSIILFLSLFLVVVIGARVAWALSGISLIFIFLLWGAKGLPLIVRNAVSCGLNETFICIPLFAFIGLSLRYSGVVEDMYAVAHRWLGSLPGGLAMGTMFICIAFAAISAGSGTTVAIMGLTAMPAMLKRNYDQKMVMGSVMAGAVLGIVIPPSIPMVLLSLFGKISLGTLLFGGVIPGVLIGVLHSSYIGIRCAINPKLGPPGPPEERGTLKERIMLLRAVVLPLILIVTVLGSIWAGICTPSEASGVGAFGACIVLILRRRMTWPIMEKSLAKTLGITVMVFWILIGAFCFLNIYTYIGIYDMLQALLADIPGGSYGILAVMMIIMFLFGMIMDDYALIVLLVPIYFPIIKSLGWDPLWFGLVFILNLQTAYLTPPYGFNLFYMRAITPPSVSMREIYSSTIPFLLIQMLGLGLVISFPILVTWLPSLM